MHLDEPLRDFLLGLSFAPGDVEPLSAAFVDAGLFWIHGFACDASQNLFGALVHPSVPLVDAPVVEIAAGTSEPGTITTSVRSFVPTYALHRYVVRARQGRPTGLSEADWTQLVELERALGGDGLVRALQALADDPVTRDAVADPATRRDAVAQLELQFDPSPARRAYAAAVATGDTPWTDWLDEAFGPWRAAARVAAIGAEEPTLTVRAEAGWQLFSRHLLALDTADGVLRAGAEAALASPNDAWTADPAWRLVVAVAREEDVAATAARVARELSRIAPERAYTMWANAATLGARQNGRASRDTLGSAYALALEHDWADVAHVLERHLTPRRAPTPAPAPPRQPAVPAVAPKVVVPEVVPEVVVPQVVVPEIVVPEVVPEVAPEVVPEVVVPEVVVPEVVPEVVVLEIVAPEPVAPEPDPAEAEATRVNALVVPAAMLELPEAPKRAPARRKAPPKKKEPDPAEDQATELAAPRRAAPRKAAAKKAPAKKAPAEDLPAEKATAPKKATRKKPAPKA